MKRLRFYITQLITFLVAFQILSLGLFAQEFESILTSSVSPEINIINTVDEFIAEVVLHHNDAVPEAKHHSKKDIQLHKHGVCKLNNIARPSVSFVSQIASTTVLSSFLNTYNYQYFEDIIPPPPKQLS